MPRYRVLPYRAGSRSASALAHALNGACLRLRGSTFVPRRDDVMINWGNTSIPGLHFKNGGDLRQASNKLLFFQRMVREGHADLIPRFWTRREDIPDDAFPIVCRTILAGHSGAGIVIAENREGLVPCPLYVQYIKKQEEYRVHVGKMPRIDEHTDIGVITIQRKARDRGVPDEEVNWRVRNHDNGFVFVRGDVHPPASVVRVATSALVASGLDFGAVDVIWNERQDRSYVLEINTAPGLEGQTVEDYANFFRGV